MIKSEVSYHFWHIYDICFSQFYILSKVKADVLGHRQLIFIFFMHLLQKQTNVQYELYHLQMIDFR